MPSSLLVSLGIACLLASYLALRRVMPQDGRPPSAWTSTDTRATAVTLGLMTLMVFGVGMLISGLSG